MSGEGWTALTDSSHGRVNARFTITTHQHGLYVLTVIMSDTIGKKVTTVSKPHHEKNLKQEAEKILAEALKKTDWSKGIKHFEKILAEFLGGASKAAPFVKELKQRIGDGNGVSRFEFLGEVENTIKKMDDDEIQMILEEMENF